MFTDRLESFGYVRSSDEESRRVEVVVSSGDVARDGAVIDQSGWNLRNYERNPVVLWAHDDHSLPIARAVSTRIDGDDMVQEHEFGKHARADEVFQAIRGGFVNATSVRWIPGETEVRTVGKGKDARNVLVFSRGHELLEVSYVPIPADPNALVLRADGSPLDLSAFGAPAAEVVRCVASDCRNETDGGALCDDCSSLLDSARVARASVPDPRAQRLTDLAERIRAKAQEGAA